MAVIDVLCVHCSSKKVVKNGKSTAGIQRYACALKTVVKHFQIDANVSQNNIAIIVALFLSESLMLICITPLKGISKYNTIFYIVFLINMIMIAIVYSLSFENFNELLSLLILNNILIAMGSLWIWRVKYYKANQLLDLSGNLT